MSYNGEREPYMWERYRPQIVVFFVTLAVGCIGALLAAELVLLVG
jgi:hypothetical protein